jgi:hypothetical protein
MFFVGSKKIYVSEIGIEDSLPLGKEHQQVHDQEHPPNAGSGILKWDSFHWIRIMQTN